MEGDLASDLKKLRERCEYMLTYEQQDFYQLAQLLRPEWSDADVFEITTKLAHTVNPLLTTGVTVDSLRSVAGENKSIALFVNIYGLKNLLSGISCGLLCNLSAAIPMGDPTQRLSFLLAVQQKFQLWSNGQLETLKAEFDKLSPYLQHNFVMDNIQDAHTPAQVCNAITSLFSFTATEVLGFKAWIESLDGANINIIANLFQFTEDFIFKVWTRLCAPLPVQFGFGSNNLATSTDGWGALGASFNQPFPHMNASDDDTISEWQRNKKRTAGGTSKHIINLTDSSTASVSLRLSSSLNVFIPHSKRSHMQSTSMSPSAMHPPIHDLGLPTDDLLAHPGASNTISGANLHLHPSSATSSSANHSHLNPSDGAFDSMLLTASEPPLGMMVDQLRSSSWTVLPPKFYTEQADDGSGSMGSATKEGSGSLSQHFPVVAPGGANSSAIDVHRNPLAVPHATDELRTASTGLYGLNLAQGQGASNQMETQSGNSASTISENQSHIVSPHTASFFPTAPSNANTTSSAASHSPHVPATRSTRSQAHQQQLAAQQQMAHQHQMPSHSEHQMSYDHSGMQVSQPRHQQPSNNGQYPPNVGFLNGVRLELRITGAPPAKSVYQRILKPYPVVKVIGADKLVNRVLFLKASLWNADGTAQMTCLDGGLQVAAQPTTATFKKLKVLNTSVQKGTLFKLKFQLEIFGEREQALDIHVWSDPMEVVSHTVYLTSPSNAAPTPATVTETIPNTGTPGTRVIVLGSSFIDHEAVRVKFGDVIAHHTYHEKGAIIAIAPAQHGGAHSRVLVSVSNDGVDYSATNAAFTYA